jgi:hypothetical protein
MVVKSKITGVASPPENVIKGATLTGPTPLSVVVLYVPLVRPAKAPVSTPPGGTVRAALKVAEVAVTITFPATFAVPVMAVAERGLTAMKQPRLSAPKTDIIVL